MEVQIKDITTSIKYGPHLPTIERGDFKYLKGNHFDEDYHLNEFANSFVAENEKTNKCLLEEGDVILAGKGNRNFAWAYEVEYGACIASSLFYILKIDREKIHSKYLALVINSPKFQHQLKLIGLGATIPVIPKKELMQLKFELPTLEKQQQIISINELMDKQIQLERAIIKKKKQLKKALIDSLTN